MQKVKGVVEGESPGREGEQREEKGKAGCFHFSR